jgi:hypothetical protein
LGSIEDRVIYCRKMTRFFFPGITGSLSLAMLPAVVIDVALCCLVSVFH